MSIGSLNSSERGRAEEEQPMRSLLVKQLGIYCVQLSWLQQPVYFQVMENVHKGIAQSGGLKFDLKGSNNKGKTGKPDDFRDMEMRNLLVDGDLRFDLDDPCDFRARLSADVATLRSVGLMDYSLMVWALKPEKKSEQELEVDMKAYAGLALEALEGTRGVIKGAVMLLCSNQGWESESDCDATTSICLQEVDALTESLAEMKGDASYFASSLRSSDSELAARRASTYETRAVHEQQRTFHRRKVEELVENIRKLLYCNNQGGCEMQCVECIHKKARGSKVYRIDRLIGVHKERLQGLERTLHKVFKQIPPPKRSRNDMLIDAKIGRCYYKEPGSTQYEEFEVACGISDVATLWGKYQRVTELGKLLSCHYSSSNKTWLHPNDWGLSAKPPHLFANRFEESLCIYFNCELEVQDAELKRCCIPPARPEYYYCDGSDARKQTKSSPDLSASLRTPTANSVETRLLA